jgi:hypothetical protein
MDHQTLIQENFTEFVLDAGNARMIKYKVSVFITKNFKNSLKRVLILGSNYVDQTGKIW